MAKVPVPASVKIGTVSLKVLQSSLGLVQGEAGLESDPASGYVVFSPMVMRVGYHDRDRPELWDRIAATIVAEDSLVVVDQQKVKLVNGEIVELPLIATEQLEATAWPTFAWRVDVFVNERVISNSQFTLDDGQHLDLSTLWV